MNIFSSLFGKPLYPQANKPEVNRLVGELIRIGKNEDYLCEHPTSGYNTQFRHLRTREIGKRLDEIGGYDLMENAYKQVKKKLGV